MLMHSSIVSRFRGALLGAVLGESLGAHCPAQRNSDQVWATVECWAFQPLTSTINRSMPALIHWLLDSSSENTAAALATADPVDLISLLPAMLLGFDQPHPGPEGEAFEVPRFSSKTFLLDKHLLRQAIALILRGCPPHQLIEQLVALWRALPVFEAPQVINQLWQVQALVESGSGLALTSPLSSNIAQPQIESQGLDAAASMLMPTVLYGFLCTPENGRVALLRAARLNSCPQITCALTGALVGAWGGVRAMPLTWRRCFHSSQHSSALSSLWQVASESALFHLADQLADAWAGVYYPGDRPVETQVSVMASLPRDALVIVSPV